MKAALKFYDMPNDNKQRFVTARDCRIMERMLRVAGACLQRAGVVMCGGASSVVAAKQLHLGSQRRKTLLLVLLLLLHAVKAHITLAQLSLQIGLQAPR